MPPNDPQLSETWELRSWRTLRLVLTGQLTNGVFWAREVGPWSLRPVTPEQLVRDYEFVGGSDAS